MIFFITYSGRPYLTFVMNFLNFLNSNKVIKEHWRAVTFEDSGQFIKIKKIIEAVVVLHKI